MYNVITYVVRHRGLRSRGMLVHKYGSTCSQDMQADDLRYRPDPRMHAMIKKHATPVACSDEVRTGI